MPKNLLRGLLLFVLVLGLSLLYIISGTFTEGTFETLENLNKTYLLVSLFFLFLVHTFDNLRLFIISRASGVRYSFLYGYVISFINTFGATVTPAHVGGEGTAVYMLLRKGVSVHKVASIVTLKTITGLVFFVIALPFLILHSLKNPQELLRVFTLVLLSLLVFGLAYLFVKRVLRRNGAQKREGRFRGFLVKYVAHLRFFYRRKKLSFILASLSAVMLYVSFLMVGVALLLAFGKDVSPLQVLLEQIGLLYAIFVSPTPGGSGVGEIGGLIVFGKFLTKAELGVFVILWRLISQYISAFLGGVIFLACVFIDLRKYS
ncbi:MAG: flippase-like domain-containing protein [Aquificae bacterium]|nr:flippase-like domain-containing protein [Aquificota bacterium]